MVRKWQSYALIALTFFLAFILKAQQSTAPTASPENSSQPTSSNQSGRSTIYETATVLKTTTRLVVLDVVATDHKDKAVPDLKREDFTILEDGKEQKVAAFSFQQPAQTNSIAAKPPEQKLPGNVFTNIPRYNPTSALNVVLLDALNTTAPHQAYVRQQMIKFLEKLPEGRPVAIYTLSTKLTLLQDFTSDPTALKEVMKKVKNGISPLLDNPTGGEDMQILPAGAVDSGLIPQDSLQAIMQFEQERVSFQTDLRVNYTLNALNAIARSLAGYPGRKNLIWISEAFPFSIDPNLELTGTGDAFAGTRNYAGDVASAADHLIDAQIAIYAIDARALETSTVFSASNSGTDKFGRSMSRNPQQMMNTMSKESADLQNAHATMQDMASRTGGRAFYNRNDLDTAISRSMDDGSTYYTLAYYPDNKKWDGKFRKIQVKVNRPGVKLRHRIGYYAVDPIALAASTQKEQAREFSAALSLDSPSATGLRFQAGVVQPQEKTNNKLLVNFGVDPHAMSFDHQADGLAHASLDCVVQAYSEKGKLIKTEARTIAAQLRPETFSRVMQTVYPCQDYIDLPPGSYLLRLGVRDNRTGLIGTTAAKVTVVSATAQADQKDAPAGAGEKKP